MRSTEARRAALSHRLSLALGLLLCALAPLAAAQTLSNTVPLSFGSFTAVGGGSITISNGGARTKTGSLMLVSQGGAASAAQISISSGSSNAGFTVTLPANGTVQLSDGTHTMSVDLFTSNPSGSAGSLNMGGAATVLIGATLTVNSSQAPGNYTGSFNITIDFP